MMVRADPAPIVRAEVARLHGEEESGHVAGCEQHGRGVGVAPAPDGDEFAGRWVHAFTGDCLVTRSSVPSRAVHDSAKGLGQLFFDCYAAPVAAGEPPSVIVDVGAANFNGSLRDCKPEGWVYVGVDIEPGKDVDLVGNPWALPLTSESADLIVSTSCLEHDGLFWVTFLEMARVLRPGGALYINAPSNGKYHPMPDDCWRFYPDAGQALERWGQSQGSPITLLESFLSERRQTEWNDFVMVFGKPPRSLPRPCMHERWKGVTNIRRMDRAGIGNPQILPEDQRLLESRGLRYD